MKRLILFLVAFMALVGMQELAAQSSLTGKPSTPLVGSGEALSRISDAGKAQKQVIAGFGTLGTAQSAPEERKLMAYYGVANALMNGATVPVSIEQGLGQAYNDNDMNVAFPPSKTERQTMSAALYALLKL